MKERPILFSGPMVRALLAGTKTQTRRVVKPDTKAPVVDPYCRWDDETWGSVATDGTSSIVHCPYGQPGDRLWVRETWRTEELDEGDEASGADIGTDGVRFAADETFRVIENTREASDRWCVAHNADSRKLVSKWRPSIYMPRWACRLELELTQVRVERLQDISEKDAIAEGIASTEALEALRANSALLVEETYRMGFRSLWDSLNAKRGFGWDANPWVWALTVKRAVAKERAA